MTATWCVRWRRCVRRACTHVWLAPQPPRAFCARRRRSRHIAAQRVRRRSLARCHHPAARANLRRLARVQEILGDDDDDDDYDAMSLDAEGDDDVREVSEPAPTPKRAKTAAAAPAAAKPSPAAKPSAKRTSGGSGGKGVAAGKGKPGKPVMVVERHTKSPPGGSQESGAKRKSMVRWEAGAMWQRFAAIGACRDCAAAAAAAAAKRPCVLVVADPLVALLEHIPRLGTSKLHCWDEHSATCCCSSHCYCSRLLLLQHICPRCCWYRLVSSVSSSIAHAALAANVCGVVWPHCWCEHVCHCVVEARDVYSHPGPQEHNVAQQGFVLKGDAHTTIRHTLNTCLIVCV